MLNLPDEIAAACKPLFDALPLEQAMPLLVGSAPKHTELVTGIVEADALAQRPELVAALWLYVDDLERSHTVSQSLDDAAGACWHGIMHRREGDFSNSHYWFRRAARYAPLTEQHELDPGSLVDAVATAKSANPPALLERQRQEWQTLFVWYAAQKA